MDENYNGDLDVPDDDLGEVINALGDIDGDHGDFKDELLNFDYASIQFDIIPPNFSVNIAFTLPSIFKANPGQPNSFDDNFKEETEHCSPLIAQAEASETLKHGLKYRSTLTAHCCAVP